MLAWAVPSTRNISGRRAGELDAAAMGQRSSGIPRCSQYTNLQLHVNFPDCWSGKTLDSPDHKSHMAYSSAGRCPPSHPVAMPAITVVYSYLPPNPSTTVLSSGGQYSGHADFINSWNETALTKLVDTCLNGGAYCEESKP